MTEEVELTEAEYKKYNDEISAHVSDAYASIAKAEAIADKHNLDFSFSIAYGMGGWYTGDPEDREDDDEGWNASSTSC